jgi:sugar O-acyltransferase (sialic acid O-acetyltransferase NeuD family)
MRPPLLVLGTSLWALEVADVAEAAGLSPVGFLAVGRDPLPAPSSLSGLPVLAEEEALELAGSHCLVAALEGGERRSLVQRFRRLGFSFATLRHPSAYVAPTARLEEGCVVGAGVGVASYSTVGRHALLGQGALIGHHTRVGAFALIGQGANVAGSCRIGEEAQVGAAASIVHRRSIGRRAYVEAGAVVLEDVAAGARVSGVPARPTA